MKKILPLLVLFPMMVCGQTLTENYTKNTTYKTPTATSIVNPTINQANQNVTYFDGLGRPIQQVAHQQSGTGKDIVTPIEYDSFGRQEKEYLPHAPTTMASLDYKPSAVTEVGTFYNTPTYENTLNPYSKKEFEPSPLNRVLKQAAPGNAWALNSGHEIKLDYQTNTTADAVKLFSVTANWDVAKGLYDIPASLTPADYLEFQLYKTITYDENTAATPSESNGSTVEFKNKEGQVVLKRTYGTVGSGTILEKHDTYYVYDQFGNLTFVVPPLVDETSTISNTLLEDLCYQYKYDSRNRLVEKKLPGKQWEYIVYDKLDRVVATGPTFSPFNDPSHIGVLGWLITKYDVFNRPVYTGWEQSTTITNAGRLSKQNSINALTTLSETKQSSGTIDGITANYSNTVLPTTFKLLTVNYYDDYNFPNAPSFPAYGYNGVSSFYNNSTMKPKGLPTGSWTRVITASNSLQGDASYVLYDYKARPIRNYTANYMSGFTQTDTDIDFSGKTTHTNTSHKRVSTDPLIWLDEYFTYTPQDRLLTHTHKVWTGMVQLLAENTYDELGQLISKNVGNTTAASLQKVDYAYNIRGWLTDINNTANLIQGSDPKDLFAFKINYNAITGTIAGVKLLYNGNISETYWRNNSDNTLRKYGYEYDNLNRLKNATFQTPLPDGTSPGLNFYQEQMSYDKNGNIMNLFRTQKSDSGGSYILPIDNLTYFYGASNGTNQLTKVSDITNRPEGFKDDSDGYNDIADDYTYDLNGNLKTDANKNITAITYNHLNLPTKITFGTTGNITYIYNASGQKVQKQVFLTTQGGVPVVNYYLNGFQYIFHENYSDYLTKLQFVPTSEGYYDFIKGKYVFNYTDHLGNIRLSYAKNPTTNVLEILEESNYYPFGLKHSPSAVVNAQPNYKYKYQGQERQDELGLNWDSFKWRNYDYAIGRFMCVDPLSEKYAYQSHYNFSENRVIDCRELEGLEGVQFTVWAAILTATVKASFNNALNSTFGNDVKPSSSGTTTNVNIAGYNVQKVSNLAQASDAVEKKLVQATKKVAIKTGDALEITGDTAIKIAPALDAIVPGSGQVVAEAGDLVSLTGTVLKASVDVANSDYKAAGEKVVTEVISAGVSKVIEKSGADEQTKQFINSGATEIKNAIE